MWKQNLGWKIFFWFWSIVLLSIFVLGELENILKWTFIDWMGWISALIMQIGIYSYAFKKTTFSRKFWRIFLWINIIWWIADTIYYYTPLNKMFPLPNFLISYAPVDRSDPSYLGITFITLVFLSLPALYINYRLAYGK